MGQHGGRGVVSGSRNFRDRLQGGDGGGVDTPRADEEPGQRRLRFVSGLSLVGSD
jgi:hypothetical protein